MNRSKNRKNGILVTQPDKPPLGVAYLVEGHLSYS